MKDTRVSVIDIALFSKIKDSTIVVFFLNIFYFAVVLCREETNRLCGCTLIVRRLT